MHYDCPFQLQIKVSVRDRPLRAKLGKIAAPTLPAATVRGFVTEWGFRPFLQCHGLYPRAVRHLMPRDGKPGSYDARYDVKRLDCDVIDAAQCPCSSYMRPL